MRKPTPMQMHESPAARRGPSGLTNSLRELLVLGKLRVRSCSAPELLHSLHDFSEDESRVTAKVFGTLLSRLKAAGFIRQCTPGAHHNETTYKITADGLARFATLMSNGSGDSRSRQVFRAKLLYLDHVDKGTRRRIARTYMQRIVREQIKAIEMHGFFQHDAKLPAPDRTMMLRVIRRERAIAEAELEWMRTDLAGYL